MKNDIEFNGRGTFCWALFVRQDIYPQRFLKGTNGGRVEYNRRHQLRGETMERIAWVTDSTGTLDEELSLNDLSINTSAPDGNAATAQTNDIRLPPWVLQQLEKMRNAESLKGEK